MRIDPAATLSKGTIGQGHGYGGIQGHALVFSGVSLPILARSR